VRSKRVLWILGLVVGCDVYDPTLGQSPSADAAADEGSTSTGFLTGLLGAAGAAAGATGAGRGGLGGATGSAMAQGGSAGLGSSAAGGVGAGAGNSGGGGGSGGRSAGGSGGAGSSGGGGSGGRTADAGPAPCPTGILLSGENNTALHGGTDPTDVHFKDICPMGGPVIGYTGSIDSTMPTSVGKMATVCGKIAIDASSGSCKVLVNAVTTMPMRGTVGDVPFTQTCPPNQVVVAFQGRAGTYLDQVSFTCAPLVISSTPMGYQLAIGTRTGLPPSGGNGGTAFQDGCAAGQIVHGTNVTTFSGIVDAAGVICGAFSLVGP